MSSYRVLAVFVEGPDDTLFFKKVLEPRYLIHFQMIKYIEYAQKTKIEVDILLKSFSHKGDYLYICDMDARGDKSLCITKRKEKEKDKFKSLNDDKKIFVVREEIESWYFAGIPIEILETYKIKELHSTESLTKEEFLRLQPKFFNYKIDFLNEIINIYSLETAVSKNESLDYFVNSLENFS